MPLRRRRWLIVALVLAAGLTPACGENQRRAGPREPRKQQRGKPSRVAYRAEVRGDQAKRMAIPILMYHPIMAPPPGTPYPHLWVRPKNFRDQMDALKAEGYHAVTLRDAFDAWERGGPLPRRPVVVSFDDGYPSQQRNALPVLRRLRWPGVLNLKLDALKGEGTLRPSDVRELIEAGWEIDSHTVSHSDLTSIDPAQLEHEVADSRTGLQRRFGVSADFFCYPSGRYDGTVVAAVRRAGYRGATTEIDGLASAENPFEEPRVRVNGEDTVEVVLEKLAILRQKQSPERAG
jgi:peptidoglycan/xylan/chitin deacetylase (PgdA/CDA1 family)